MRVGAASFVLIVAWSVLTVWRNYEGKISGLFCLGERHEIAASILAERPYVFRNSYGYDGQAFLAIARDPWRTGDEYASVDSPAMRYRRILLPVLAWTLALGHKPAIWYTFPLVLWLMLAAGAAAASVAAARRGWNGWWGLGFLLLPPVLTSIDRMTVDGALASLLLMALVWPERMGLAVAAIPLVRETGWVVAAALLWGQGRRRMLTLSAMLLPALAWSVWLKLSGLPGDLPVAVSPLQSIANGFTAMAGTAPVGWTGRVQQGLDLAALAATCGLFVYVWLWWRKEPSSPAALAGALFALFAVLIRFDESWIAPYAFGRILAPVFVTAVFFGPWPRLAAALTLAVSSSVLSYFAWQALGVLGLRTL